MSFKIAFAADTHLGYSAKCRVHAQSGVNMRVRDGLLGWRESVDQMLAAEVDLMLHGGDLFHRSHPGIGEIAFARRELERLAGAGVPIIGVTGNHDFTNDRGKFPATYAVHDPDRKINMVTEPLQVFRPYEGVNIHAVSHLGLVSAERAFPVPVEGEINIFTTHGSAQVPGHEIFSCVDSPGEAVVGYDLLSSPWDISLLGHYHGQSALPGFSEGNGQAWYAGSLLRRGFSDPEGGRGWLLVTINDDGSISVEPQYIRQRKQFDLPVIDAAGLTGEEVEEKIREHLSNIEIGEAIIRQRVINCPVAIRRGVDSTALNEITADALVWQLEFIRPDVVDFSPTRDADVAVESLRTASTADLPGMWDNWFSEYAQNASVPENLRTGVAENGKAILREVSAEVESGTSELAGETND